MRSAYRKSSAHSLATLGHETVASATISIMRKATAVRRRTDEIARKITAQKEAKRALLADKAYLASFCENWHTF
ncbi:hypothetical protein F0L67_27915 [Escherichia coli]|nr:hypothetical protein F0L67_27915 [Escherichia coli]